jgi:DNA-binding response OmpR family regulator
MTISTESQRLNVLLIDDTVAERDLYELVLRTEFDVLTASRGAEGARLAERAHPDAIVLDVMMPGIDGWQTCARLKSNATTASIPVILLTGCGESNLSERAVAVGASALLHKPCSGDRLRDTILATLGRGTASL